MPKAEVEAAGVAPKAVVPVVAPGVVPKLNPVISPTEYNASQWVMAKSDPYIKGLLVKVFPGLVVVALAVPTGRLCRSWCRRSRKSRQPCRRMFCFEFQICRTIFVSSTNIFYDCFLNWWFYFLRWYSGYLKACCLYKLPYLVALESLLFSKTSKGQIFF